MFSSLSVSKKQLAFQLLRTTRHGNVSLCKEQSLDDTNRRSQEGKMILSYFTCVFLLRFVSTVRLCVHSVYELQ